MNCRPSSRSHSVGDNTPPTAGRRRRRAMTFPFLEAAAASSSSSSASAAKCFACLPLSPPSTHWRVRSSSASRRGPRRKRRGREKRESGVGFGVLHGGGSCRVPSPSTSSFPPRSRWPLPLPRLPTQLRPLPRPLRPLYSPSSSSSVAAAAAPRCVYVYSILSSPLYPVGRRG